MILPLWRRQPPERFADFHRQEERIAELENRAAKQRELNRMMLAYVEADMASPWMASAKDLADTLREALKEE